MQSIAVARLKCCFLCGREAQTCKKIFILQNVCDILDRAWLILTTLETLKGWHSFWHMRTMKEFNSGVKSFAQNTITCKPSAHGGGRYIYQKKRGIPLRACGHHISICSMSHYLGADSLLRAEDQSSPSICDRCTRAPLSGVPLQDFLLVEWETPRVHKFILIVWFCKISLFISARLGATAAEI